MMHTITLKNTMRAMAMSLVCLSASLAVFVPVAAQSQEPPAAQAPPAPAAATQKPPAAQDEYVPIDEIPEHDRLPAAPFLIGAYTFVWLAFLGYVWTIWRRLVRVEEELKRVAPGSSRS